MEGRINSDVGSAEYFLVAQLAHPAQYGVASPENQTQVRVVGEAEIAPICPDQVGETTCA